MDVATQLPIRDARGVPLRHLTPVWVGSNVQGRVLFMHHTPTQSGENWVISVEYVNGKVVRVPATSVNTTHPYTKEKAQWR